MYLSSKYSLKNIHITSQFIEQTSPQNIHLHSLLALNRQPITNVLVQTNIFVPSPPNRHVFTANPHHQQCSNVDDPLQNRDQCLYCLTTPHNSVHSRRGANSSSISFSSSSSSCSRSSVVGWFWRAVHAVKPGRRGRSPDRHHLVTEVAGLNSASDGPSSERYMRRLSCTEESEDLQSDFTLFMQLKPRSHTAVLIAMAR